MNFTGTSTLPRFGNLINLHVVALAAGLALATAAAISLGALGDSPTASPTPELPAMAASNYQSHPVDFILYVVDSQAQAEAIKAVASQDEASLAGAGPSSATIRSYLVGGSAEADHRINEQVAFMAMELIQAGDHVPFRVVDLRN